ncbi:MAG: MBL fold metallo-hydrolase [Chloroflexi bacterium]|nr:MBL fold metallo-hydrolase [Chloroflexota bacterium]MBM3173200.1 MBL fold metallo-hydrolase [Chloroflexota bacterium]MBM3174132.1 MBL fold metallo-hydrolase [Chloroflexota bacterium]MBM4449200.1 MBL fold metallo-hydrolase [Chloroflexota bacterium]
MDVKLTTLSENTAGRVGLLAEWGLSVLVEVDGYKVLLDTGLGISTFYNAAVMGIDLSQIDKIVLSHGHRDHTGGLRHVLQAARRNIDIIAHPDIWTSKYSRTFGKQEQYAGIPHAREALEDLGACFKLTQEPVWLTDNIVTTGEIPLQTEYEKIDAELYVKEDGQLVPDPLKDDLALVIKSPQGLVVVLGCGHRGIINTLHRARELTGVDHIRMVIGGTHLIQASRERLDLTIAELREMSVERLGVSHCTGLPAASVLFQEFGDSFFFNNAGRVVTI